MVWYVYHKKSVRTHVQWKQLLASDRAKQRLKFPPQMGWAIFRERVCIYWEISSVLQRERGAGPSRMPTILDQIADIEAEVRPLYSSAVINVCIFRA